MTECFDRPSDELSSVDSSSRPLEPSQAKLRILDVVVVTTTIAVVLSISNFLLRPYAGFIGPEIAAWVYALLFGAVVYSGLSLAMIPVCFLRWYRKRGPFFLHPGHLLGMYVGVNGALMLTLLVLVAPLDYRVATESSMMSSGDPQLYFVRLGLFIVGYSFLQLLCTGFPLVGMRLFRERYWRLTFVILICSASVRFVPSVASGLSLLSTRGVFDLDGWGLFFTVAHVLMMVASVIAVVTSLVLDLRNQVRRDWIHYTSLVLLLLLLIVSGIG